MQRRSTSELASLAIGGNVAAGHELSRQIKLGIVAAKLAMVDVVRANTPGAKHVIAILNRREVESLNRSWEAGRLPGISRDTGHGPKRPPRRPARLRRPCGHAPRRASNTRTAGSRRRSASRGASRGDPDDGEPEPPGPRFWRHPHYGDVTPGLYRLLLAVGPRVPTRALRYPSASAGTSGEGQS